MSGIRCKVGDLAVVVRSDADNLGRIVRCVRLLGDFWWCDAQGGGARIAATWEIDVPLRGADGTVSREIADDQLRPLRDSDGDDEMLRIAGKPEQIGKSEGVPA